MDFLKVSIVSILIVLILANIIGLQFLFVLNNTFLDPSFYKKIGTKQEFYAQIRQLIFRLVNRSLPNGREGMTYIEKALTQDWLKKEIDELVDQLFDFMKGRSHEPPIIPIYKLKEVVMQSIDGDRTLDERQRMVQFWFDPLPDKVRLQDFISTQLISGIRERVIAMERLFWVLLVVLALLSGIMYAVVRDWKSASLWITSASLASGIQATLTGLGIQWLIRRSSYVLEFYNSIVAFEIPEESAWGLIYAFKNGFTEYLVLTGAVIAILSIAIMYFIPIKERSLTLVK